MEEISSEKTKQTREKRWILIALMVTIMLAAMDVTIVSTAIPQIVGDLGGFSLFSWVFSIYLLAQTITIPIYGKLADLYGRKPILLFGTVVFLIGSALSAFSWDMLSLIFFRGLQGFGAGAIMATVNTLAGDLYSIEERGKIQGWLSSVWGMAAIIGPTLGGAFAEYATWRWIFLINIPIGIISMTLILIFLKEKVVKKKHHIDFLGAIMMLLTGGTLIFTLMQGGQSWAWFSFTGSALIAATLILIVITIFVERRSPEPIMPIWVWKNKILLGSNLAMIFMGAIMLGPNMYLPVFAQSVFGLGAILAGLVLASSSIGWPIASSLSAKLYLKIGFRNTSLIGAALIIVFAMLFPLLSKQGMVGLLFFGQIMLGAGFGLLSTPNMVGIQSIVPWNKRGVVTSSNMFSRYLGQSIGAALLGGVFNARIRRSFATAPDTLKESLPEVNNIMDTLQSESVSQQVEDYLTSSFQYATDHVFIFMGILGICLFAILLILPRRYPIIKDKISSNSKSGV